MTNIKKNIRQLSLQECEKYVTSINAEKYRAKQIYDWIWKKNINSFSEIKNLSKKLILQLETDFCIEKINMKTTMQSVDKTIKFAFSTITNKTIESVLIPANNRTTACVSTQSGCVLSCSFCATGKMKKTENLNKSDIYEQVHVLSEYSKKYFNRKLSNIVFMGMGEPLLNYDNTIDTIEHITSDYGLGFSPSRITVSTAGISDKIRQLANDNVKFKLAISLHSANDKVRDALMPVNKKYNLKSLSESIKYFHKKTNRRITFEYLLLKDVNDSLRAAKELAVFCKNFPCKINIIEYNPVKGIRYEKSEKKVQEEFVNYLKDRNIIVNVRNSKGQDINAACGQLASVLNDNKPV